MYPTSEAYKTAIAKNVRDVRITGTITLADNTVINIADEDIVQGSLYFTEQCVAGEDIEIGNVYASEMGLSLTTMLENPYSLDGARIALNFGVNVNPDSEGVPIWEYVPLGYYYVDDIQRKTSAVNLKALDGMLLFDVDLSGVTTTGTPQYLIAACCNKVGITLATGTAIFDTFANAGTEFSLPVGGSKVETCRDLIMWVCQLTGTFARMNRLGQLEIMPVTARTSVKTISKAERFTSDISDFFVKVNKVTMKVGETEYSQGTNGMTMILEENPFLIGREGAGINTILSNILNQVTLAEYIPFNVDFVGDPSLQAGDFVKLPATGILVSETETETYFLSPAMPFEISTSIAISMITHHTWRYRGPHNIRAAGKSGLVRGVQSQRSKAVSSIAAIASAARVLAEAANQSTQLINDAIGGYVLIRQAPDETNEILIMDSADPVQAVKIWRWNMGGLGYSDNVVGADNPLRDYKVAMTMDGAINADFIKTGTLDADLIFANGINADLINVTDLTALTSNDDLSRMVGTGFETYDPSGSLMVKQGSYQTLGDQSATFTRASTAYTSTGTQVAAGVPRYETGKFSQAITAEEGTTNIIPVADHDFQNGAWAAYGGATVTVTGGQTDPFSGSGAYRIQTSGGTHVLKYYASWGVSVSGTPYAESVWVKCLAGTIRVMQLPGSTYQDIIPADGYVRVKLTGTGDGAAGIQMQFRALNVADALDFVVYRPQIETKAYITSWTDSARSPESLTIPGSVLNPQEGTWEHYVYIDSTARRQVANQWPTVFHIPKTAGTTGIWLYHENDTAEWTIQTQNDAGTSLEASCSDSYTPDGWHRFAVAWKSGEIAVLIDGVRRITITNPNMPTGFAANACIGSYDGTRHFLNTKHDDFRISSIARTDEEILAAYQSNQPLPADRQTTWKSSFDGTLAQTVAQYGLYSESGTLIGQVIKGSEIYGTNIQTGNKTDTSYIKLGAYADEPLEVVKDRKAALQIWTYDTGGSIVFYDTAVNDIRGMITVHSNAYGDGLRLIGRSISGGYNKDVVAEGRFIRLHAPDVYIGNGEDYGTTVWGDLHITGDISIGGIGKGCIVDTASYGRRWLYAVEGPEIRLEEKGRGTLIDGQCRIDLHPKFLQTIEKDLDTAPWVIDITPHFDARLYVSEIGDNYFVVKECGGGVSNGRFSWSLSAVKIGCIGVYMPEFRPEGDILTSSWEDDLL